MNFLCPACKTPLPVSAPAVVACTGCGVEVDLTRVDTAPGQARLWPEVDLAGETLGSFKLLTRAGSGGMGTVYVADGLTGRCAVKVLSAQMAADPGLRERFRREAQALRAVQHPGVVRIIDEGSQNGFCWYAMEHVEGADLRARLMKGPLTVAETTTLARELLEALAAVHDAKLVHRDLKPGNILLSSTGARLCDFGIARFDGNTTLTESAALLGSLRYMAPEQRAGITTPKSDLYSLGLVLHEALAGGLPGEKELPGAGRLGKLINALLEPSPAKRPLDAHAALRLIPLPKKSSVSTLVAVGASVLGVGAFAAWGVVAAGLMPNTTAVTPPPPAVVAKVEAPLDAGSTASLELDAGALAVANDEPVPQAAQAVRRVTRITEDKPQATGDAAMVGLSKNRGLHEADLRKCYEDELVNSPDLAGMLTAVVTLTPRGAKGRVAPGHLLRPMLLAGGKSKKAPPQVDEKQMADLLDASKSSSTPAPLPKQPPASQPLVEVSISESTLANQRLEDCVAARVRQWDYARVRVRSTLTLTWNFERVPEPEPVVAPGVKPMAVKGKPTKKPLPQKIIGTKPGEGALGE